MGTYLKGTAASPKHLYLILVEYAMKFLAITALLSYIIGGVAAVFWNVDPLGRYIEITLSNSLSPTTLLWARIFLFFLLGSELYRILITYFLVAIIFLVTLNITLQNLIKYINETSIQRSKIRVSRLIFFMKAVDAFRAFEVYFRKKECMYATCVPVIIYGGSTLIVLSNSGIFDFPCHFFVGCYFFADSCN